MSCIRFYHERCAHVQPRPVNMCPALSQHGRHVTGPWHRQVARSVLPEHTCGYAGAASQLLVSCKCRMTAAEQPPKGHTLGQRGVLQHAHRVRTPVQNPPAAFMQTMGSTATLIDPLRHCYSHHHVSTCPTHEVAFIYSFSISSQPRVGSGWVGFRSPPVSSPLSIAYTGKFW